MPRKWGPHGFDRGVVRRRERTVTGGRHKENGRRQRRTGHVGRWRDGVGRVHGPRV